MGVGAGAVATGTVAFGALEKCICKYPKWISNPNTTANNTVSTSAFTNRLLNSIKLPAALRINTITAAIRSPCIESPPVNAKSI